MKLIGKHLDLHHARPNPPHPYPQKMKGFKMQVHKFFDPKYNLEFPYCIELIVSDDGYDEVIEVLWFATEEEQIKEFNIWLKDYKPYTEH